MIRTTSILGCLVLVGVVAQGLGCATASTGPTLRDRHASAALGPNTSRMVVAGPAVLLHLDVDGKGEVFLYTVARRTETDADCVGRRASGLERLEAGGASNHVNLAIAAGEVACIAAGAPGDERSATAQPGLEIAWHARAATTHDSATSAGTSLAMRSLPRAP